MSNMPADRGLRSFEMYLHERERSEATIEKYMRSVRGLLAFSKEWGGLVKETVIAYKRKLGESGYAVASVNAAIAGINCYLKHIGRQDCCVRQLKMQRQIYRPQERELTKQEYLRLLQTAKRQDKPRLYMILQTIAGTGIRISELKFFTVEAARVGKVVVSCKNKNRVVLIPQKLRTALLEYVKKVGIMRGMIFVTRGGRAVDRGNVWAQMKALCAAARVQESKVFPHNLRKLFAAVFYSMDKDIAKLADVLGHSSVNTTRIYIATSGREHLKRLDSLGLVV